MTSIPAAICRIRTVIPLTQQFQTPLSHKQKAFSGFFIPFLKCAWNLEHFQRKDEYPSLIISEIIDAERRVYLNV